MTNKRKCRNRDCNKFFTPAAVEYIKAFWCSPECKEIIAITHYRKNQANKERARKKAEKQRKSNNRKAVRALNQDKLSHQKELTQ